MENLRENVRGVALNGERFVELIETIIDGPFMDRLLYALNFPNRRMVSKCFLVPAAICMIVLFVWYEVVGVYMIFGVLLCWILALTVIGTDLFDGFFTLIGLYKGKKDNREFCRRLLASNGYRDMYESIAIDNVVEGDLHRVVLEQEKELFNLYWVKWAANDCVLSEADEEEQFNKWFESHVDKFQLVMV